MTRSMLGLHWMRLHPDGHDLSHIERMQYRSCKLFEWHWSNRDACRELLTVLPADAYILARDHPLSEQKQDMWRDPAGTGTRHANDWADKVRSGNYHLPTDRTFFLGINEPDATSGDRNAIDIYTAAYLNRLRQHGLRGGGFSFSTGHPRTVDGTGATKADYTVFERSHRAIVEGHHIGVLHIYGTAALACVPGHYDRIWACPWQDVEWVVGECGADEHVIGGGSHDGYLISMAGHREDYCGWLDRLILGVNDPRIHSWEVFTYDYSHPWSSFDARDIRGAMEAYDWQHVRQAAAPIDTHLPNVIAPTQPFGAIAYISEPIGARIRNRPVVGDILTAVPYGEQVHIIGRDVATDWFRVRYGDVEGYMSPKLVSLQEPQTQPTTPPIRTPANAEQAWQRCIAFVRRWEGGFANNPNDPGGATNKGITIATYTRWRQAHGQPQPTVAELRALSDEEANRIYFEWYWKASGADLMPWPLCLAHFDTVVNAGVGKAEEIFDKSGGSFMLYVAELIDFYAGIDGFVHFGRAWMKRRADLLREVSK